jgi:beta-glucanase (GH16 family)
MDMSSFVQRIRNTQARTILDAYFSRSCTVLVLLGLLVEPAWGDPGIDGDSGDTVDTSSLSLTFSEEFDALDVSEWGPDTRWIAHTPWSGDFGGARFSAPMDGFPFTTENGLLRIEASRDKADQWRSGLLASVDPKGKGFAQQYGYFEMRARLPIGPGVWPAFWLIGLDRSKATAEVDVMEYYGDKPGGYSTAVHVWHRDAPPSSKGKRINVFRDADPTSFHTYGVKIDPMFIRMYFDGQMVWKADTQEQHRQPMYILLNLALVDEETRNQAPDPSYMFVDHVRAYSIEQ